MAAAGPQPPVDHGTLRRASVPAAGVAGWPRRGGGGCRPAHGPGAALDELHRVVADAVLLAVVEDADDVGVVQPGRQPGLGVEPPQVARGRPGTAGA